MNCVVKYPQELGTFLFTIALGLSAWGVAIHGWAPSEDLRGVACDVVDWMVCNIKH
jgi:hypothetical protein